MRRINSIKLQQIISHKLKEEQLKQFEELLTNTTDIRPNLKYGVDRIIPENRIHGENLRTP